MSELTQRTASEATVLEPANLAAEAELLGGLFSVGSLGPEACAPLVERVCKIIAPSDFDRPSNGLIFAAQLEAVATGRPCDLLVTAHVLREREQLDTCGGESRLHELAASASGFTNAEHHAHLVHEASVRRAHYRLGGELQSAAINGGLTDDLRDRLGRAAADHARGTSGIVVESWAEFSQAAPVGISCLIDELLAEGALAFVASQPKKGQSKIASHAIQRT